MSEKQKIINIAVIAHVDAGKSTLVDAFLNQSGVFRANEDVAECIMDSDDIERERGITIKMNAVRLNYNGYILNLIDTPGHVDFTYEVSRSMAACDGAILVVDAAQGIEAQTLANVYLAMENNLEIIPVINKIDLPNADIEKRIEELNNTFGQVMRLTEINNTIKKLLNDASSFLNELSNFSIIGPPYAFFFSPKRRGRILFNNGTHAFIIKMANDIPSG